MSVWRRKVLGLFPHMRRHWQDTDATYYWIFFDMLPMVRAAHAEGDFDTLGKIYGFAEWCLRQGHRNPDMANAAGVAFYEHLFDGDRPERSWGDVIPWLSPYVVRQCWVLWEARLTQDQLQRLQNFIRELGRDARHRILP